MIDVMAQWPLTALIMVVDQPSQYTRRGRLPPGV